MPNDTASFAASTASFSTSAARISIRRPSSPGEVHASNTRTLPTGDRRRRDRRSARALGAYPLPRSGTGRALGPRHRSRLHAWPRRVLAAQFRLARTGGAAQRLSAIQAAARRYRAAFPARAGQRAVALPAPAVAWLAGLGLRVHGPDPAPRRSRPLWRRCERRPHDHRAVTARLRPLLCARAEALWDRGDRRCVPRLVGLRRRCRVGVQQGSAPREYQPLLVHRGDRLVVLAVLCAAAPALAVAGTGRRPNRLCRIPGRNPATAAQPRRASLCRYPALDGHEEGRPFRRDGTARRAGIRDPRILRPAPQHRSRRIPAMLLTA